jgi:hypothetical protein
VGAEVLDPTKRHLRRFTASLLSRSLSQRSKHFFKEAECRLPASP